MKNKLLLDHFLNPRQMGRLDNPTHTSISKSETCSDIVKMMVVITREGIIEDIRTEVYGCGYSIAGASFFNEYAKGKKVSDVVEYMQSRVKDMLIDVPETNRNCISLPLKAFEIIRGEYNKHE